ncbi:MAG TPA: type II secretion system F family protein [Bryobacteraceae bacterium]|nr:type II secretion system F family protein [Bryobacteraceae bacterium]
MLLGLILFLSLTIVITAVGYFLWARPSRFQKRLGSLEEPTPAMTLNTSDAAGRAWIIRVVETIGEKIPLSPQEAGMARRTLIAAGYRSDRAVTIYYGVKVLMAIGFVILAGVIWANIQNPMLRLMVWPALAALGFFVPNLGLDMLVSRRQERIRFALPDALDLMVVCMEAGLGLDQAINSVSKELHLTHKDLSDELGLVTLEMRAGKRRVEALKNLAARTGESELSKLVATMVQADRFGTSVAESLRTHSDFMRVKRRQAAEERAAKVGVKLVFPIFFFIMPAIMLVAAGPGIMQMVRGMARMGKGTG